MAAKKKRKSEGEEAGARPLALVRLFGSLGVVACFFLPWLQFSCSGTVFDPESSSEKVFARASGMDLLEGRVRLGAESDDRLSGFEDVLSAHDVPEEPLLWAWVGGMALLILIGGLSAVYGPRLWSSLSAIAATGMLLLAVWFYAFGFNVQRDLKAETKKQKENGELVLTDAFRVSFTPAWHVSTALLGMLLLVGVADGSRNSSR